MSCCYEDVCLVEMFQTEALLLVQFTKQPNLDTAKCFLEGPVNLKVSTSLRTNQDFLHFMSGSHVPFTWKIGYFPAQCLPW